MPATTPTSSPRCAAFQPSKAHRARVNIIWPDIPHVYVFLDFASINQHPAVSLGSSGPHCITLAGSSQALSLAFPHTVCCCQVHAQAELSLIKEAMARGCPGGAVVIVDDKQLVLTRSWCLFEIWTCVRQGNHAKLRVCFPPSLVEEDLVAYETHLKR